MEFSSKLLQNAVDNVSSLPGIGKRSALRLVLHLLKQPKESVLQLSEAIKNVRLDVVFCKTCHNISDNDICDICSSVNRNKSLVCVVEDIRDVMAIESTNSFNGVYHVLGGKISPMEGVGPGDLTIDKLVDRVVSGNITEIIFALSPTIEGDTTNFYIFKKLNGFNVKTSTIAKGISVGNEIEYADEITLGRSIINRIPFENSIKS